MDNKKIEEELRKVQKLEWLNHPYTKHFFNTLVEERQALLDQAETLSSDSTSQVAKDIIVNKLTSARQLKKIINYVKK